MSDRISSARHELNIVGTLILALMCIPSCIFLVVGLADLPPDRPGDPDAGKALGIYQLGIAFSGLLGAASVVSLVRSSRALKGK